MRRNDWADFDKSPHRFGLSRKRGDRSTRRPGRSRHSLRPGLERLKPRLALAISALDPTFGQAGVVLGELDAGTGSDLSNPTAAAVQADGKIVVAGTYAQQTTNPSQIPDLAMRRYNADGYSVGASFGANGQIDIPLPASYTGIASPPRNVMVEPNAVRHPGGRAKHPPTGGLQRRRPDRHRRLPAGPGGLGLPAQRRWGGRDRAVRDACDGADGAGQLEPLRPAGECQPGRCGGAKRGRQHPPD